jgi:hypothetical protein
MGQAARQVVKHSNDLRANVEAIIRYAQHAHTHTEHAAQHTHLGWVEGLEVQHQHWRVVHAALRLHPQRKGLHGRLSASLQQHMILHITLLFGGFGFAFCAVNFLVGHPFFHFCHTFVKVNTKQKSR